jgi:hypothetical protein
MALPHQVVTIVRYPHRFHIGALVERRILLCGLAASILTLAFVYWYDGRNDAAPVARAAPQPPEGSLAATSPFQYDTSIMSNPAQVAAHIQDTVNLYSDIKNGTLPAVSFVKPSGYVDGHPSSSKLDLFEGFVKKIVDQVEASPTYTKDTVILITEDEGGGYYDSGYVQPVDFFGDGTRIPLIVVANPKYLPLRAAGYISHKYAD